MLQASRPTADEPHVTPYAWRPLGELLVERGLLGRYDLEVALTEQKLSGQLLGELLVSKRLVSPIDMAAVLAAHNGVHLDPSAAPAGEAAAHARPHGKQAWRPLGRILVDRGHLTESGLQRALLTQRHAEASLGEILVQRRYVTPGELADALAEQQGLTVHPVVLEAARELEPADEPTERYELRAPTSDDAPLYSSQSYLDATDFAFEALHSADPDALEIVRIKDGEEETVWDYTRGASDAFRAETAEARKRFTPLMFLVENEDSPSGAPSAA